MTDKKFNSSADMFSNWLPELNYRYQEDVRRREVDAFLGNDDRQTE